MVSREAFEAEACQEEPPRPTSRHSRSPRRPHRRLLRSLRSRTSRFGLAAIPIRQARVRPTPGVARALQGAVKTRLASGPVPGRRAAKGTCATGWPVRGLRWRIEPLRSRESPGCGGLLKGRPSQRMQAAGRCCGAAWLQRGGQAGFVPFWMISCGVAGGNVASATAERNSWSTIHGGVASSPWLKPFRGGDGGRRS